MTRGGGDNVSLGYCVPCAYPRICSNCAVACFHILGFIAREQRDRGDPVNYMCRIRDGIIITGLLRFTRNDKNIVCAGAQESHDLGPVVCIHPRDTSRGARAAGGCAFFVGKEIKGKCAKIFL